MSYRFAVAAAAAWGLSLAAAGPLSRGWRDLPPVAELPGSPFSLQDAASACTGNRALGADLAWIQLLQYAAEDEWPWGKPPGRPLGYMKEMTLRVVRLDPGFHRAYLFGSSILGWGEVNRPDEAVEVLREGLRRDPGQPLYSLYLAALAYQKKGDADKMIGVLESMVDDPAAPALLKPLLANIYKKRGDYAKAMRLWEQVLDDENNAAEHARARKQIAELRNLLKR